MSGLSSILAPVAGLLKGKGAPPPASTLPAVNSQADADLVAFVRARYRYSQQAKDCMTRTWATCLAFYVGEHWREWNKQQRTLVDDARIPPWRVRMRHNQIPGFVSRAASKLIRSREIPRALAQTGDEEDEAAADAGTRVLSHWWRRSGMEEVEHEANVNRYIFGAAFLHDYWDPNQTARVPQPDYSRMQPDPETGELQPKINAVEAPVGDVCPECLTVFDVFPEPCERWRDISWCIVARRKPVAWFEQTFGVKVEPDNSMQQDLLTSVLPGAFGGGSADSGGNPDGTGQATLLTYYEAKSRQYPQGRTVMICGDRVLFRKDRLPMPHGKIPLTMMSYRYVPKRLWPKGVVEELIDPQREVNRSESQLAQVFRLFANPKRYLDQSWNVDSKSIIGDAPDEIVEGNFKGVNPTQYIEQPPSLPPWIAERTDQQIARMQDLSGQHEVSEGTVPSGVTAASAIQLLQGADNEHLSYPAYMGKLALEEFAGRVLTDIVKMYREPRLISTFGRDKQQQLLTLSGSDIGERDVIVDLTNGVEDSDQVRAEQAMGWLGGATAQQPMEIQLPVLRAMGWTWLADALAEGYPQAMQAQQAQMAQQQEQMQSEQEMAAQQQQMEAQGVQQKQAADAQGAQQQQAIQAAQAEQQQAQADQAHQQSLQQQQDAHALKMSQQMQQMILQAQAAKMKQAQAARPVARK